VSQQTVGAIEQSMQAKIDAECIAYPCYQLRAEQRVPPSREKVVSRADPVQVEQRCQHRCQAFFTGVRGATKVPSRNVLSAFGAGVRRDPPCRLIQRQGF